MSDVMMRMEETDMLRRPQMNWEKGKKKKLTKNDPGYNCSLYYLLTPFWWV
jgi:hypothetical protein